MHSKTVVTLRLRCIVDLQCISLVVWKPQPKYIWVCFRHFEVLKCWNNGYHGEEVSFKNPVGGPVLPSLTLQPDAVAHKKSLISNA